MAEASLAGQVAAAPIGDVRAMPALKWLCRAVPLQHRLFPLLRTCLPDRGLIAIPLAGGQLLYPAAWVNAYNASLLVSLNQLFPERAVFEAALGAAPEGAVVDVGANVGAYVLLARRLTRARIIAYEPSPFAWHVLSRMLRQNGFADVDAKQAACGECAGRVCLHEGINSYIDGTVDADEAQAGDFEQRSRQTRNRFTGVDVEQVALDEDLAAESTVALIKIDCEGYEHRVLRGAQRTLVDKRPHLFVELHPDMIRNVGDEPAQVCAFLKDSGYDVDCWNFQQAKRSSFVRRVLQRYVSSRGRHYRNVEEMLGDLPKSRPQQVYLVATPVETRTAVRH